MDLKAGDVVTFLAEGDRRFFCISSLDGDIVHLVCPCCGVEGRALLHEVRRAFPAELQALLRAENGPVAGGAGHGGGAFLSQGRGAYQDDGLNGEDMGGSKGRGATIFCGGGATDSGSAPSNSGRPTSGRRKHASKRKAKDSRARKKPDGGGGATARK